MGNWQALCPPSAASYLASECALHGAAPLTLTLFTSTDCHISSNSLTDVHEEQQQCCINPAHA